MPKKKKKAAKAAKPKAKKAAKSKGKKTAKPKAKKVANPKVKKAAKSKGKKAASPKAKKALKAKALKPRVKKALKALLPAVEEKAELLSSETVFEGPLFRVLRDPLLGAQRELAEETGYSAKKWKPLVEYYASPGFLGESMKVFVAEGLVAGDAHPEDDEQIAFRLVKLSELVKLIEKGAILDGKTLSAVLLYARSLTGKGKK